MPLSKKEILTYLSPLPSHLTKPTKYFSYGTAGYRANASILSNVVSRCALIAYLRSTTFAGKNIGIMLTASHNPEDQNGVKFIDHNGDMFDETWEKICDEVINCEDKDFYTCINRAHRKYGNMRDIGDGPRARLVIGHDTRPSHSFLVETVFRTLKPFNIEISNYEFVTTPELHYLVRISNILSGLPHKNAYLEYLCLCYNELKENVTLKYENENPTQQNIKPENYKNNPIAYIDTANGVVESKLSYLKDKISLNYHIINNKGPLNYKCGSDYIKTHNLPPQNINTPLSQINHCVSFDGDVDRLIYFYSNRADSDTTATINLVDGDRLAVLLLTYINTLITNTDITCGIILTFYSNTALLDFLHNKGYKVSVVNTGVKNLVRAARTYDIGIYFESNGHGSVIFSERVKRLTSNINTTSNSNTQNLKTLSILQKMFDPCIGDALSNFLIIHTLFNTEDFYKVSDYYLEYPNRLICIPVKNKSVVKISETNGILEPNELRKRVEQLCAQKEVIRVYVRPSGTEECIRVYVECSCAEECDSVILCVAQDVYDLCGGTGHHPEITY